MSTDTRCRWCNDLARNPVNGICAPCRGTDRYRREYPEESRPEGLLPGIG